MIEIYYIFFIILTNIILNSNCQYVEGYFKNQNDKNRNREIECAVECLIKNNCKLALIKEKNCELRNKCFQINQNEENLILVKKVKSRLTINSNFSSKIKNKKKVF